MTHELSKVRLEKIAAGGGFNFVEVEAMAAALLPAYEQEPVATVFKSGDRASVCMIGADLPDGYTEVFTHPAPSIPAVPEEVIVLLNHLEDVLPDDAFNLIDVKTWNNVSMLSRHDACRAAMLQADHREMIRSQHAEWSQLTFGNVGPVGPLKHLAKEAMEAAAEPDDLSEWADMQFLLWDAQRRAGITDEQINQAMIEKLAVNKARVWPEPKDGEPRLHLKGGAE